MVDYYSRKEYKENLALNYFDVLFKAAKLAYLGEIFFCYYSPSLSENEHSAHAKSQIDSTKNSVYLNYLGNSNSTWHSSSLPALKCFVEYY